MAVVGGQSMVDPLRRVLLRPPSASGLDAWHSYGWRDAPDPAAALNEHEALCELLSEVGSEVLLGEPDEADPDAIYVCDPALTCDRGVVMLRPGKELRAGEPDALERDLGLLGVQVAGRLEPPGTAEGGDAIWLDPSTLLVGRSYRTNDEGIAQLQRLLGDVRVVAVDVPHVDGPASVLHLMSLLSPLDRDLMLAFVPLVPVRVMEMLAERSIEVIPVPEEEFASMGANVLAVAPRVAVALDGNPATRTAMERGGVEVRVYEGSEISRKGEGGPTCLTRPILRAT
jgi:N-dimethylarginine dimethylaminohydrolase